MTVGDRCLWLAVALILSTASFSLCISCIGDSGKPVEWFTVLKAPQNKTSFLPFASDGLAYFYFDASRKERVFEPSEDSMGRRTSAVGATISRMYESRTPDAHGWYFYNDETPSGVKSTSRGHTKGVLFFDATGGFWLVHSVPAFPVGASNASAFVYPSGQAIYGQSFLCLTLDRANLEVVATQLFYYFPQVYDMNLPSSLAALYPNLNKLFGGYHIIGQPGSSVQSFSTVHGMRFTSYAKNSNFGKDLYSSLIGLSLRTHLMVETWMRPYCPSCCAPKCNYSLVVITTCQLGDMEYKETSDHSKWAISEDESLGIVCIGDINHNYSQWTRAGGSVCFSSPALWNCFHNMVTAAENCVPP